jgi:hypothetical protein
MNRLRETHEDGTFNKNVNKFVDVLLMELKSRQFYRDTPTMRTMDAKASSIFFESCIKNLEGIFTPHLNSYSAMRWFFYFRRLPNAIFEGNLNSTMPNARALIETYASQSKRVDAVSYGPNGFVFNLDDSSLRHIARFVAFCNIMYDLQVSYRLANKGFSFSFASSRKILPLVNIDIEKNEAVRIYDQRHNRSGTFFSKALVQMGLASCYPVSSGEDITNNSWSFWGLSHEKKIHPADFLDKDNYRDFLARFGENGHIMGRYGPSHMNLEALFDIYRRPSMSMHTISDNASLSLISLLLGGMILIRQPMSLLKVVELGYFIIPNKFWTEFSSANYEAVCEKIRKYLPQFIPPTSVDEFHSSIAQYYSSTWPLEHGNPIRVTDSYVCVDMWAASTGFLNGVQFPTVQGKVANDRAERFENVVQEALDRTAWADIETRVVRQKSLRYQGRVLTDIDAIGCRQGTLLLISCKSIPYTLAYDKGEHGAIRNAETTITAAVEYWNTVVEHLRINPVGENYDFSKFEKIIGVVCTPFVVYTSVVSALKPIYDNLRPASSLDELVQWMESDAI